MATEIIWTAPALEELNEVYAYIREQRSKSVAVKVSNAIVEATDHLSLFPQIGNIDAALKDRQKSYRSLVEGHYKIIYYIEDEKVYIALIWDCRQNPLRLLEKLK